MKAKPTPGERDLVPFCLEKVITNGGIFEHPYESEAFDIWNVEKYLKVITINQSWFGLPWRKKTKLAMPKWYKLTEMPYNLEQQMSPSTSKRLWANKVDLRSETPIKLINWMSEIIQVNNDASINDSYSNYNTGTLVSRLYGIQNRSPNHTSSL